MSVLTDSNLDLDIFYRKENIPALALGDKVKLTIFLDLPKQVEEGEKREKERTQVFEGVIISKHLSSEKFDSTITVRKMFPGGATEKVFILNSPWVKTIEVVERSKVRRAKLYYLRDRTGKSARLKRQL